MLSNNTKTTTFAITDPKLYVPVVTLLTQDNTKLHEQLRSGFKRTINWNKYQPKVLPERQNQYLEFLIDPSFQGVNRLFCFFDCSKVRTIEQYTQNIIFQQ